MDTQREQILSVLVENDDAIGAVVSLVIEHF